MDDTSSSQNQPSASPLRRLAKSRLARTLTTAAAFFGVAFATSGAEEQNSGGNGNQGQEKDPKPKVEVKQRAVKNDEDKVVNFAADGKNVEFNAQRPDGKRYVVNGPVKDNERKDTTATGTVKLSQYNGQTGIGTFGQNPCALAVEFVWHENNDRGDSTKVHDVTATSDAIYQKVGDFENAPAAVDSHPEISRYQLHSPSGGATTTHAVSASAKVGPDNKRVPVIMPAGLKVQQKQSDKGLQAKLTWGDNGTTEWYTCDKDVRAKSNSMRPISDTATPSHGEITFHPNDVPAILGELQQAFARPTSPSVTASRARSLYVTAGGRPQGNPSSEDYLKAHSEGRLGSYDPAIHSVGLAQPTDFEEPTAAPDSKILSLDLGNLGTGVAPVAKQRDMGIA